MPTMNKFHLSLNVKDLDRSVAFYEKALGIAPAKHHADYAKFEVEDPPLVLALEPGRQEKQDHLNHIGIRLNDANALRALAESAHAKGLDAQYLQGVECCYSRQTKICLTDPDENLLEFYLLEADLEGPTKEKRSPIAESANGAASGAVAWDHLLGTPFPSRISLEDRAASEVKLRGTFNLKRSHDENLAILLEAKRVLSARGELTVHLLAADRPVAEKLPRLPGPAALVEHTPTESEVVSLLEEAGFCAILIKRLSHSPVFQFGGAEMRELLLTARVAPSEPVADEKHFVVYKGPFKQISDDFGSVFRRGVRAEVDARIFASLKETPYADAFVFLNTVTPSACSARAAETADSYAQPEQPTL